MIYGDLPEDLGLIDLSPVEMMFWMYCPVRKPGSFTVLPSNLYQFKPILDAVYEREGLNCAGKYIYLTAKTLYVSGENIGNRPGWHSDGFGTNDINYIWYNRAPTEFIIDSFELPADCTNAMEIMAERASWQSDYMTFPNKHLLRLTPSVIHRSPVGFEAGMRTFVKVSISDDLYNLEGNSRNPHFPEFGATVYVKREPERNHPHKALP